MPMRPLNPETLEAYRALVEAADDAILIADWDSAKFVDANRVAIDKLGYQMADLRQMTGGDLSQLPRDQHERFSRELVEDGETRVRAVPVRRKDGSTVRMDLWVRKFVADGKPYHINVLREVGAVGEAEPPSWGSFERARGELLASEAFYRGVVTFTDDAVVICDLEDGGRCVEANPAAAVLFRIEREAWSEVTMSRLVCEGDGFEQVREGEGQHEVTERSMRRSDGSVFAADIMQSVFTSTGEPPRKLVVSVIRDVSERRAQAARLERSYDELRDAQGKLLHAQKLAALGEVAASLAHEVNNPAAFVLMNVDDLARQLDRVEAFVGDLSTAVTGDEANLRERIADLLAERRFDVPAMREALEDNRAGIERLRSTLRDLSIFAQADRGDITEVDLNDIVRRTARIMSNDLRHRARVTLQLGTVPPIVAHAGKLAQVVMSLLLNAAQAIVEGDADANEITVATHSDADGLEMTVTDTGKGMDEGMLDRIFEPLFTTRAQDGATGLGLSLCVEIVREHQGTVSAASEVGEGSSFTVRLPHRTGLALTEPAPPKPTAATSGIKRVLVIDDDEGMARAYRRMLRKHDATVLTSGRKALDLLAEDDAFDLIICDLMMPDMDGLQVYEALAESAPAVAERIVFCTGGAFTPRMRGFVDRVSNRVIEKPLRLDLLDGLLE